MLILTRRLNESLVIGEDRIKIKVLGVKGSQVRLGIEAPNHITVNREEIQNRIDAEEGQNE